MDTNDQYFHCLCRTCMNELVEATSYDGNTKPQQQWQSIFDRIEECGAFRIAELLTNAVPQIEVQPSDQLPKRICSKCLQQLLTVYRFQQMCIQSEQQMRQQVSKKRSDLEIPMEGEIETTNAGSYALKALQPSSTHQNLEHTSIQESLLETTEQMVKPEAAETSDDDIDKLLKDCRDAEGNLSEFVKNEPIEDDEPSMEYSDGETTASAISDKGERLSIKFEEQQISETKKEHKRIHCDEKAHKCDLCEKSFEKNSDLRVHIRKHTGEKPYKCKYCQRPFSQSSSRLKHMRLHLGKNVHRCELCPLAFPAASELRAHSTTHKKEDPKTRERNMKALKEAEAELEIKAKEFRNYANMLQHKAIHKRAKINCDICGKSFTNGNLKVHKRIHSGEKPHKCHLCERSFGGVCNLRRHIRIHTGEKPYKCKYCERSFHDGSHRLKHMRLHLGGNVHRCELCPLAFPAASELRAHFTTHKNEDSEIRERNMKALKEAEAELEIKAKENTKAHSNIDERHESPYCPRRFKKIANLAYHKESHKRLKREACDICGKFVTKGNLNQHKLTHGGEKPYKCHLCEKSFSKKFNLRIHIRHHTGERPYKCKYCNLSFSHTGGHFKHMRIHLGDNVHRCELCPLAFPAALKLRAHFTTHENEDSETRERNMKALKEAEAKLQQKLSKMKKKGTQKSSGE